MIKNRFLAILQGDTYVRFDYLRIPVALTCVLWASAFTSGCAATPQEEPKALTIHLPDPAIPEGQVVTLDQTIKKDLFNIRLSPAGIEVNGTKVADVEALEALLAKYPEPAITIATHRCYSGERAAKVMNLAREHTNTPIAFGSFGDYDDPECQ